MSHDNTYHLPYAQKTIKNKHMKIILSKSLFVVALGFVINSCQKKPDIEYTSTVNMSAEWFVRYYEDTDPTVALIPYRDLLTYNTSDPNRSQVWIHDHFWPFKAKPNVDYTNLTFTTTDNAEDILSGGKVKIYEGKVIQGAGISKSGNMVDSIFLRVEFLDDDPGFIYQIRGHQRTGFFEDEY